MAIKFNSRLHSLRHFGSERLVGIISVVMAMVLTAPGALAATNPSLGMADSFAILSGTYTNTAAGTTINGDLGYTTPPAVSPTVNGTTHIADTKYNQAGIDQNTALANLNSQPCTFTFAPGAIDLAIDTTHGPIGVYTPGVYCIDGAASIGTAGITLDGAGTYIFRMTGALNTVANSAVRYLNGASACDVWWTPGAATTLGANSIFGGTNIDAAGITIGSQVTWVGRALAFGGTVSTASDTISATPCAAVVAPPPVTTTPPVGGSTGGTGGGSPSVSGSGGVTELPRTGSLPVDILGAGILSILLGLYSNRKQHN